MTREQNRLKQRKAYQKYYKSLNPFSHRVSQGQKKAPKDQDSIWGVAFSLRKIKLGHGHEWKFKLYGTLPQCRSCPDLKECGGQYNAPGLTRFICKRSKDYKQCAKEVTCRL